MTKAKELMFETFHPSIYKEKLATFAAQQATFLPPSLPRTFQQPSQRSHRHSHNHHHNHHSHRSKYPNIAPTPTSIPYTGAPPIIPAISVPVNDVIPSYTATSVTPSPFTSSVIPTVTVPAILPATQKTSPVSASLPTNGAQIDGEDPKTREIIAQNNRRLLQLREDLKGSVTYGPACDELYAWCQDRRAYNQWNERGLYDCMKVSSSFGVYSCLIYFPLFYLYQKYTYGLGVMESVKEGGE